jgi:hypothetical protein
LVEILRVRSGRQGLIGVHPRNPRQKIPADLRENLSGKARRAIAGDTSRWRTVRTPQSGVAGNTCPP